MSATVRHIWCSLLLSCTSLLAAAGYEFPIDQVRWYRANWAQEVDFSSAGDQLRFAHSLTWTFALRCTVVTDGVARVRATITRIQATATGPGVERSLDTRADSTADPLFGHLALLAGTTLELDVNQADGQVRAVAGAEVLRQRLAAAMPAASPGQPSPFAADLAATYSDEALARWWSGLLALPGNATSLPLGPGLVGIERTWAERAFTLRLGAGAPPTLVLAEDPSPVTARLTGFTGSGEVATPDGMPTGLTGQANYTLEMSALTQAVVQTHRVRWTLETLPRAEEP